MENREDSFKRIVMNYKRTNQQINENIQFLTDSNLQPTTGEKGTVPYLKDIKISHNMNHLLGKTDLQSDEIKDKMNLNNEY